MKKQRRVNYWRLDGNTTIDVYKLQIIDSEYMANAYVIIKSDNKNEKFVNTICQAINNRGQYYARIKDVISCQKNSGELNELKNEIKRKKSGGTIDVSWYQAELNYDPSIVLENNYYYQVYLILYCDSDEAANNFLCSFGGEHCSSSSKNDFIEQKIISNVCETNLTRFFECPCVTCAKDILSKNHLFKNQNSTDIFVK